jgi:SAM-dependent methyltransferase
LFRFKQLVGIGDLSNKKILDVGCGLGHLYGYIAKQFSNVSYTGIDIVPDTILYAQQKHPTARFICQNLLEKDITESFDYVLINGVFNNAMEGSDRFMKTLLSRSFAHSTIGLGFNFISTYVNFTNMEMAYHNPLKISQFCIEKLSPKITMHHSYERRDVAIFVYR